MACPSTCGDVTLVSNPTENCTTAQRYNAISRIAFFPCSVDLPDPIQGNIEPLFADGTIAWSSILRNVTLNDPTTQDFNIGDCIPALSVITGREITFEDAIAITSSTGSPAVYQQYWDYNFWQDKVGKPYQLRAMWIYCNGDARIAKDENGNYLTVSVLAYLNYERPTQQGGPFLEFKSITARFNGDPLALYNTPAFNTVEEGIVF